MLYDDSYGPYSYGMIWAMIQRKYVGDCDRRSINKNNCDMNHFCGGF